MVRIIIVLSLALVSGCASGNWTKTDTLYEIAYVSAIASDAYTTTRIQYHDGIEEHEPVTRSMLGAHPSTSDTWQYFATLGLSHYLISLALPSKWRRWWQVGGTVYHGYMVYQNCDSGLCGQPTEKPCHSFEWRSDRDVWHCTE